MCHRRWATTEWVRILRSAVVTVVVAMVVTVGVMLTSQLAVQPSEPAAVGNLSNQELVDGVESQVAILAEEEAARLAAEAEAARLAAEEEARRLAEEEARRQAEEEARRQAEEQARAQQRSNAGSSSAPPTNDVGVVTSAYTGSYFNAAYEGTRQCIVRKESGGNYGIVSSNGMYHGAYQFSRSTGDVAAQRMGRGDLVGTPASRWTRAEQDQAFWTMWNHGAGRGHWPTASGC